MIASRSTKHKVEVFTILLVSIFTTYIWFKWNFDDAYIVYRIVDNIINNGTWAYNIGENLNASTSALNTIILVILSFILSIFTTELPTSAAAHILGGFSLFICGLCSFKLFIHSKVSNSIALISSTFIVSYLGASKVWGIETLPFLAAVLYYCYLEAVEESRNKGFVLGILVLLRPDALVLIGIKLLEIIIRKRQIISDEIIKLVKTFGMVLLPWILFSLISFGEIFPSTLSEKIWQGNSGFWGHGLIYLKGFSQFFDGWIIGLSILGIAGIPIAIFIKNPLSQFIGFVVVQQFVYVVFNVPPYHWYYTSFSLTLILTATFTVDVLAKTVSIKQFTYPQKNYLIYLGSFLSVLFFCIFAIYSKGAHFQLDPRTQSYIKAIQTIDRSPDSKKGGDVAILEVGVPGYFTSRKIVDISGLVSENSQYITTENLNNFFESAPSTVLLHEPIWHFERALREDIRFKILYSEYYDIQDANYPMRFFVKRDNDKITKKELKKYTDSNYAKFTSENLSGGIVSNPDSSCILDQFDGDMSDTFSIIQPKVVSTNGWAAFPLIPDPELEIVLVSSSNPETLYKMQVTGGGSRPDVAINLDNVQFANSGFNGSAYLSDIPAGDYSIWIQGCTKDSLCENRQFCSFKQILHVK